MFTTDDLKLVDSNVGKSNDKVKAVGHKRKMIFSKLFFEKEVKKIMKTLKCDLCEVTAEGETFEEWMKALHHHYSETHAEVMKNSNHTKEDMEKWMTKNKARFEAV